MHTHPRWYFLPFLVAALVLSIFLFSVRDILPPFVIALVIAWLFDPVLDRLQKYGFRRTLAISIVYVLFAALFLITLRSLMPAIVHQGKQLPSEFPSYSQKFMDICSAQMEKHQDMLRKFGLPSTPETALQRYGSPVTGWITDRLQDLNKIVVSNLGKALWLVLIPLLAFYLLNDIDYIHKKVILLIPNTWRPKSQEILSRIGRVFGSYVRGLVIVCTLYGLTSSLILTIFGVRYSIIIGLLSGLLYAVPFLGAILITLMVFLVALATKGLGFAILMAVVMFLLNQVLFDMFISPRILGKSVGLHPVLSIFALLAGQKLFGFVGMILAVPIAASIQEIVLEFNPELRNDTRPCRPKRASKKRRA